jgi:hypothetical protein
MAKDSSLADSFIRPAACFPYILAGAFIKRRQAAGFNLSAGGRFGEET